MKKDQFLQKAKSLSKAELEAELRELRHALADLKIQLSMNKLKDQTKIKKTKKKIARVLTELNSRKEEKNGR